MTIETKNFGTIEFNNDSVITFNSGLPAFENNKKFVIIAEPDTDFYYLQSVEDGELSLVLLDLCNLMPNYDPLVSEEQLSGLGSLGNNISIYNVCVIKGDIQNMTVNLMAPIIINNDTNLGHQVILENEEYSVKHTLITE